MSYDHAAHIMGGGGGVGGGRGGGGRGGGGEVQVFKQVI